jgi:GNAT superfamily N-acetyltransferase
MVDIRPASPLDAALIAGQRRQMFEDAGVLPSGLEQELTESFEAWVQPRLAAGEYLGWIAEANGEVVGGAGLWLMPFPPHFLDLSPCRGYLLNFYVAPAMRGQGIAGRLLELTLAEARRRGIKAATLHASRFGKPVYEKYGFKPTNEMMLLLS